MKRKLIFVILVAMILAPVSSFAASVYDLSFDKVNGTVTVSGEGFGANEFLSVMSAFGEAPTYATANFADQTFADADGNFSFTFPVADYLSIDDTYFVQVGAASLGDAVVKSFTVKGSSALLNAPTIFQAKYNKTYDIPATYAGTDWKITSSNPLVVQVLDYDNEEFLDGFQIKAVKSGLAILRVETPDEQVALISVMVTV